jgi:hypothetical protein
MPVPPRREPRPPPLMRVGYNLIKISDLLDREQEDIRV